MMVVFILRIPSLHTEHTADILDWVFMAVFPHYSLGLSFTNMYVNKLDKDACTQGFIDMAALCPFFKEINATNPCCRGLCHLIHCGQAMVFMFVVLLSLPGAYHSKKYLSIYFYLCI